MGRATKQSMTSSRVRARLSRLPSWEDLSGFAAELRSPRRFSAIRAAFDFMVVSRSLKRRGVGVLADRVHSSRRTDMKSALSVSAAVDAGIGIIPIAPTCLRRSMTLMRELDRCDLAAAIHFGVRKSAESVEAHAWVQVGEIVINDDPNLTSSYAEIASGDLGLLFQLLR